MVRRRQTILLAHLQNTHNTYNYFMYTQTTALIKKICKHTDHSLGEKVINQASKTLLIGKLIFAGYMKFN